ncbi:MAG: hypothetical protein GY814_14055, partial [Gammaproteobacteria bacterium]|nr:hypothetical protein [Gammaproteobacteria bacterium]
GTLSGPKTGEDTRTGNIAIFQIGDQKIRFVIQDCGAGVLLAHYASGKVAANADTIRSIQLRNYRSGSGFITDREACRRALEALEKRIGVAEMLTAFTAAPVINH